MAASVVSLRLPQPCAERLRRLASRQRRSASELGALLVDEGLRRAEFTFIDFRDSAMGRQAYVQGTSLAVWEVAALLREYRGDVGRVAAHLEWAAPRVRAAANYAEAFPEEIESAMAENAAFDAKRVARLVPQLRAPAPQRRARRRR
jgi:hypothetical protein